RLVRILFCRSLLNLSCRQMTECRQSRQMKLAKNMLWQPLNSWSAMALSVKFKEAEMRKNDFNKLQLFAFDSNDYCDFTSSVAKAIAGKDILLCIWNLDGTELLAISGQQGLTINR